MVFIKNYQGVQSQAWEVAGLPLWQDCDAGVTLSDLVHRSHHRRRRSWTTFCPFRHPQRDHSSHNAAVAVDTVVAVGSTGGDGGDCLTAAVVSTPILVKLFMIELLASCCREKIDAVAAVVVVVSVAILTLLMPLVIFFQCQQLAWSQLLLEHSSSSVTRCVTMTFRSHCSHFVTSQLSHVLLPNCTVCPHLSAHGDRMTSHFRFLSWGVVLQRCCDGVQVLPDLLGVQPFASSYRGSFWWIRPERKRL